MSFEQFGFVCHHLLPNLSMQAPTGRFYILHDTHLHFGSLNAFLQINLQASQDNQTVEDRDSNQPSTNSQVDDQAVRRSTSQDGVVNKYKEAKKAKV